MPESVQKKPWEYTTREEPVVPEVLKYVYIVNIGAAVALPPEGWRVEIPEGQTKEEVALRIGEGAAKLYNEIFTD